MNFAKIKIWEIDLSKYTIKEREIPEKIFKRFSIGADFYVTHESLDDIYFQLTEESAKDSLRNYIQKTIDMKQKEIAALQNHLHALN